MIGGTAYVLPKDPWLFTPSRRNKLLRFDCPFTDGYEKFPIGLDQTPPLVAEFCETFTVLTPGVRFRSCVKLRPCSGRSFTCSLTTATPSSADEVSISFEVACTVSVSVTDPAFKMMSYVAI